MNFQSNRPSIRKACINKAKGSRGIGYNAATTISDCLDVYSYNLEVKVKMKELPILHEHDQPMGQHHIPLSPFKHTSLHKELTNIT